MKRFTQPPTFNETGLDGAVLRASGYGTAPHVASKVSQLGLHRQRFELSQSWIDPRGYASEVSLVLHQTGHQAFHMVSGQFNPHDVHLDVQRTLCNNRVVFNSLCPQAERGSTPIFGGLCSVRITLNKRGIPCGSFAPFKCNADIRGAV
eukprot:6492573-Amphidinium_carterae.4